MAVDYAIQDHKAWLGYLQPEGLVLSPAALVDSQVVLPKDVAGTQARFLDALDEEGRIADWAEFAMRFLGWPHDVWQRPSDEELRIELSDLNEVLEPTYAISERGEGGGWLLLIKELEAGSSLDERTTGQDSAWSATATERFVRLLHETQVPTGLLTNGEAVRLVYAPRGESPGHLTFRASDMSEVAGRPILAAFHLLLNKISLFSGVPEARLGALLVKSREYQSTVSTKLAEQVLDSLYDLLRGFQAADGRAEGRLLGPVMADDPDEVYRGLLTVLMRLVFLLYAEDRGVMPDTSVYAQHFSVHALHERLRGDAERHPDTMDQRYGAWAGLVTLFRIVHEGCEHEALKMPARHGHLFDPERYPFLSRTEGGELPLVPDGTVYRVLRSLLVLGGERLSYRSLDVEDIGSVYQTMMGFRLMRAGGFSVALKPAKAGGAPIVVNLNALAKVKAGDRDKWIKETTGLKLTPKMAKAVKEAGEVDDLLIALEGRIARNATPHPLHAGELTLQPSDERRRSGSHYTPRKLTAPIVAKTLEPIFARLGRTPFPEEILDLKVCDMAMGSGAFLVEACRQLADALVDSWAVHGRDEELPTGEDELTYARRRVAQKCLYGVDKNPMATELAKLSVWLFTLAKGHDFTFLNHSFRTGDALVGLTKAQIAGFTWGEPSAARVFGQDRIEEAVELSLKVRRGVLAAADDSNAAQERALARADSALDEVRLMGDLVVAAFFAGSKPKERELRRKESLGRVTDVLQSEGRLTHEEADSRWLDLKQISPFHWEIEFPEVFGREKPGFDAIVGNPPFLGGSKLSSANGVGYMSWLANKFPRSHGKSDLVAYFFREAFEILGPNGCCGLVSTNSIRQGDTRQTALTYLRSSGCTIYSCVHRLPWPGEAAVVVSVVHFSNGVNNPSFLINGKSVPEITAYLFHFGPDESAKVLAENVRLVHSGVNVNGKGFVISSAERDYLLKQGSSEYRIKPYLGAKEMNESPTSTYSRFIAWFEDCESEDCVKEDAPIYQRLYSTVRKQRASSSEKRLREKWWLYSRPAHSLYVASKGMKRIVASGRAGSHFRFAFQDTGIVFSDSLTLFTIESWAGIGILQSRIHETWALFFSSSLKDDPRYIPEDCFHTFPFPPNWASNTHIEVCSKAYIEFRSKIMVEMELGLTQVYNRFHDELCREPRIKKLRELHEAMDQSIMMAYGWHDLSTECAFLPEYEVEAEDNQEAGLACRFRWPDEVRETVLARLLVLNEQLASMEAGTPTRS